MNQRALAFAGAAHVEQVGPHREESFRDRRRLHPVHAFGNRQRLAGRDRAILRITAAIGQRTDLVADDKLADICANGDHFAGHLQTWVWVHAGFHRVLAGSLKNVGAIDPGSMHADQHFTDACSGQGHLARLQDFRATGFGDFNQGHVFGQIHFIYLCGESKDLHGQLA
ncbi:hypothetical protein D3C84_789340 [compost metagenome]